MAERKKVAAATRVEKTRSSFRSLISGNPNYFGNLPETGFKVVKKLATNTNYEELTSIGYNPAQTRLFATLDVKKTSGYSGDLCDDGSIEYVRFFVDFGSGWNDVGVVATDVHDIPGGNDCANKTLHPLTYSLELPYSPARKWCTTPQLPNVRAILSWNVEPPAGNENFVPVYGNVLECEIQIAKSWWLKDFFDILDVPADLFDSIQPFIPPIDPIFPEIPDLPELPYPGPDPTPGAAQVALSVADLANAYLEPSRSKKAKLSVAPHRFAFAELQAIQKSSINNPLAISNLASILEQFDFDIDDLIANVEDTTGDISFEELVDVGLDGNRQKLVATYQVKKSTGFSGDLCSAGSTEYVAFWADWDDTCDWQYLDTVEVKAYDFQTLPDGGLCYTAALPVDLADYLETCEEPKVARVRAVLSWNAPPSTTDPNALPTWGNRLDAHVLVPRSEGAPGTLTVIGGVSTEFISDVTGMASADAKFVDTGVPIYSPLHLDCPFGGLVVVRGPAVPGERYRLQVIDSANASQTLTEKVWVTPDVGPSHYHSGDADGWFDYLDFEDNSSRILGYYRSTGEDLVTIQLEIDGDGVVDSQLVQLDNTKPDVGITITEPGTDCGLFEAGTLLEGKVFATDLHMGGWSVVIDGGPAGFGPVAVTTGGSGNTNTVVGGSDWTYDTTGLVQCGYVVRVHATDRAIVNSGNHQNWDTTDVGFCILDEV